MPQGKFLGAVVAEFVWPGRALKEGTKACCVWLEAGGRNGNNLPTLPNISAGDQSRENLLYSLPPSCILLLEKWLWKNGAIWIFLPHGKGEMRTARQAVAQESSCSKARLVMTCAALLEPAVPLGFAGEACTEPTPDSAETTVSTHSGGLNVPLVLWSS